MASSDTTSQDNVIFPFRGIRYQTGERRDVSPLISPPYDVITVATQSELYDKDERNFVRVELPRSTGPENEGNDRYAQAAATLQAWLDAGVLVRDPRPALYILEQEFARAGRSWQRRGVFAALRLPEEQGRSVLSHEATLEAPKMDRLRLMRACQVMTSPILVISEDPEARLRSLLHAVTGPPEATAVDADGVIHRLWVLMEQHGLERICSAVGPGPLFIADGHHRFETALSFRREMRQLAPSAPPEAGFNCALALVTSAQDEALHILPTHRLISGLSARARRMLMTRIRDRFEVEEMSALPADEARVEQWLQRAPGDRPAFVSCGQQGRCLGLIAPDSAVSAGAAVVGSLDVSVLHRELIEPVLSGARDRARITYTCSGQAAMQAVAGGEADIAFLLRPMRISDVLAAARAGERMPQKSTFFYPKVPAGLVISNASAEPV